jgi:hypothetical protein
MALKNPMTLPLNRQGAHPFKRLVYPPEIDFTQLLKHVSRDLQLRWGVSAQLDVDIGSVAFRQLLLQEEWHKPHPDTALRNA